MLLFQGGLSWKELMGDADLEGTPLLGLGIEVERSTAGWCHSLVLSASNADLYLVVLSLSPRNPQTRKT